MRDSDYLEARRYRLMVDCNPLGEKVFLAEDALGAMRLAERVRECRAVTIVEDGRPLIRMRRSGQDAHFRVLRPAHSVGPYNQIGKNILTS